MTMMLLLAVLTVSPLTATDIQSLDGRWLRQGAPQVMPDYTEPAWQDLTVTTDTVNIIRASRATVVETYRTDGVERQANRGAPENRSCHASRESARLVLECVDQRDGGPGGEAPPVATKEVWRVDAQARMVYELTSRSGEQEFARTVIYTRGER